MLRSTWYEGIAVAALLMNRPKEDALDREMFALIAALDEADRAVARARRLPGADSNFGRAMISPTFAILLLAESLLAQRFFRR